MRIHSDKLSAMHIVNALNDEKQAGRIGFSVTFKTLEKKGSRSHANAFEVQLEAYDNTDDSGRRAGNSGSYGAGTDYAATYDEWGFLLEALYLKDGEMIVGSVSNPMYEDIDDFHSRTGFTYSADLLHFVDDAYPFDPYPFQRGRGGKGRQGYGRISVDGVMYQSEMDEAIRKFEEGAKTGNDYLRYSPRTADSVRKFLKLETVTA